MGRIGGHNATSSAAYPHAVIERYVSGAIGKLLRANVDPFLGENPKGELCGCAMSHLLDDRVEEVAQIRCNLFLVPLLLGLDQVGVV